MIPKEIQENFADFLKNDPLYQEAESIARKNCDGQIWLAGGYIYKNLARILYGTPKIIKTDLDFVTERVKDVIVAPEGWEIGKNRFGTSRFSRQKDRIDLNPFSGFSRFSSRRLLPSLDTYLATVPYDIQAIVYDFSSKQLIGDTAWQALLERTVRINDLEESRSDALLYGLSIEEIILSKTKYLGFQIVI